jgi:hypothetical protein
MSVVEEINETVAVAALSAVVRVGDGRGFVVEGSTRWGGRGRYIITAAHWPAPPTLCCRLRDVAQCQIHSAFDDIDGIVVAAMHAHVGRRFLDECSALLDR